MTTNNRISNQNWNDDQHTLYFAKQSSVGGSNKQTSASHNVVASSSNTKNKNKYLSVIPTSSNHPSMEAIESQKRRQMCVDRCTLQLDDNEKEAISLFKDHDLLEQWRSKFQKIKRKIHEVDAASRMKNYMLNVFWTGMCSSETNNKMIIGANDSDEEKDDFEPV